MKKITAVFSLLVVLTSAAKAQNNDGSWFKRNIAGAVQIQVGYREAKLDQLNSMLNANNIPAVPANNLWLNLSMSHIHKNWIFEDGIGGSFTSTGDRNAANDIRAKYNQFQVYARGGYNVSKNENIRLFPFVGLNFSDAMLRIQDDRRTQSTADFGTQLNNLTASKTLWNPQFGIELGGGFDYLIKLKSKQMDRVTVERNIPIGIRAGYYLQATNNNWKVDNNFDLNNGPSNKQSAVFVSLNIGLGYKITRQ